MKRKLWYAVKSGRKPGLFTSWDDCKLQVIGYPGASYKGFFTKEEAMEFLGDVTDKLMQRKLLMQKKRRCGMWREKYMVQCLR